MAINENNGESVYCEYDISLRENWKIHVAIRELIKKHHSHGTILDLGCSDLPTTRKLYQEGYSLIGVEQSPSAVRDARKYAPNAQIIEGDIRAFSLDRNNSTVTTVILLDVLEHFTHEDALKILRDLHQFPTLESVIVSMPIISWWSLMTWYEFWRVIRVGKRTDTGLFDRTHHILTNRKGHKRLFSKAGFKVSEEYTTNLFEGITGEWKTIDNHLPRSRRFFGRVFKSLVWKILPAILHPFASQGRRGVTDSLIEFQGIYRLESVS